MKIPGIRRITTLPIHGNLIIAVVATVSVVLAGVVILQLKAAGFFASVESDAGTMTANAKLVTDSAASGGKAIQFTAAVVTPPPTPPPAGGVQSGLHVSGSSILNGAGQQVQMHGVNYSGFEYGCIDGYMNDGPIPPGQAQVNGMKSWNINSVRIPINEDCWLGTHGIAAAYSGTNYQNAVVNFVNLLTANNISSIINLHFSGDGTKKAVEQEPMANRAQSNTFWASVADKFKNNSSVMFEPYNEPHLNDVTRTGTNASNHWLCWRDGGCTVKGSNSGEGNFVIAGMQEMMNAIRGTGATNVVIITGEDWGADLSGWQQYKPTDSANQMVAGWHQYHDGLACGSTTCWNSEIGAVLATNPVLATEVGQIGQGDGCGIQYVEPVLNWLDSHNNQGYYAWTWGPFSCTGDPALITDNNWTGTPTQTFGSGYKAHLLTRP